mmetsp:Transcript_28429/g.28739  ORF Transcript_28429/g.28739 Transcript_28429/m.28739 type:complete len:571 (+) Transcript_28429:117-1829(+)
MATKSTYCSDCEKNIATHKCTQCALEFSFFCEECVGHHNKTKAMRSHVVVPLDSAPTDTSGQDPILRLPEIGKLNTCARHASKTLDVYCVACDKLICERCGLFGHQNHQMMPIDDAVAEMRDELQASVEIAMEKVTQGMRGLQNLKNLLALAGGENDKIKADIKAHFDEIVAHVRNREEELLNWLSSMYQRKKQMLSKQIDDLGVIVHNMHTQVDGVSRMLELGESFRIIAIKDFVFELRDKCQTTDLQLEPVCAVDLSYVPNANTFNEALILISAIGQLRDEDTPDSQQCSLEQVSSSFEDGELHVELLLTLRNTHGHAITRGNPSVIYDVILDLGRGVSDDVVVAPETSVVKNENGTMSLFAVMDTFADFSAHVSIFGEHVKGSPLPLDLTLSEPQLVWGPGQGLVIGVSSILKAEYSFENLRTVDMKTVWASALSNSGRTEFVELDLAGARCVLSHVELIAHGSCKAYRLSVRRSGIPKEALPASQGSPGVTPPAPPNLTDWVPLRATPDLTPLPHGDADHRWKIVLDDEERIFLGPVEAIRLDAVNPNGYVNFYGINVYASKLIEY